MPRIGAHPREVDAPSSILYRTAKQLAREGRPEEARALVEAGLADGLAEIAPGHQLERVPAGAAFGGASGSPPGSRPDARSVAGDCQGECVA